MITRLLRRRAAETADHLGYLFLAEGETEAERLTWRELDERARSVAAALRESCAPGARALLLFPPGLDFVAAFFGCLYAGVVAVPAYPPRPRRDDPRLRSIARDAAPAVVLTTSGLLAGSAQLIERTPELAEASWLAADALPAAGAWEGPDPRPADLAFLQYTSGSTASPKGVMVSHGNLAHNERMIQAAFRQDEESVVVGWLPLYHDMGLIGNVLQPLWSGGRCVLMAPAAFLQRPRRWLEAIDRYRATTSGGPNFAYDLCARRIGPADREGLDLSSWRVAFNGAEPVRAETLERFAAAFAPCGFRREAFFPCYGLAEATLLAAGGAAGAGPRLATFSAASLERHAPAAPVGGEPERRLVGCGGPWLEQRLVIVGPETAVASPPGRVGEIWLAGPSVARGYWGQPEETERVFRTRLAGATGATGEDEESFLRTGDLGFFAGGELFVTGRLKDLIILRGRNHYPQDLELTAERSHPALRPGSGAAFSVNVEGADGEERLVIVQEVERRAEAGADFGEIGAAVRRAIAGEHEVPVHEVVLVRAGTVPKTSSGKIQRRLSRTLYQEGRLEVLARSGLESRLENELESGLDSGVEDGEGAPVPVPVLISDSGLRAALLARPEDERPALVEEHLRRLFSRLTKIDPARIDPEQPLAELGLDSLVAVELKGALEAELDVSPSVSALLDGLSLREAARQVLALATSGPEPALQPLPGSAAGEHPLSWGQSSLWFLYRLAPQSAAYNMPAAVRLSAGFDREALRQALQAMVDRHAVLRTTYGDSPEGPVQRVAERIEAPFFSVDAAAWSAGELESRLGEEAYRPFDLERGPVLRMLLFERGPGEDVLLFCLHHIAGDLWSLAILVRELGVLYARFASGADPADNPLPALTLSYADYARWQVERLAGPEGQRLWEHWRARLAGVPALELPADRARPELQSYHGAVRSLRLGAELSAGLRALARSRDCTLFMILLAAYQALLSRISGQDDFLVGCPTSGRAPGSVGERLTGMVGYFVNPVALRADLAGEPAVGEHLQRVRRTALDAFEHQDLPLALLAERLQSERDSGRAPLIQALFVLQKSPFPEIEALAAFSLATEGAELTVGGLTLTSFRLDDPTTQFDLALFAGEIAGAGGSEIAAQLRWSTDLFDAATIERLMGHLVTLVRGMVAEPERAIADLDLLTAAERREIEGWNRTAVDRPERGLCLHQLFEAQVERTPDAVAVVGGTESVTYRELNRRANQLAHTLRRCGIRPEGRAGVLLDRTPALVAALLGVLKAGGAYVPLDPAYPADRLAFTAEDARIGVLLSESRHAAALSLPGVRTLALDTESAEIAGAGAENPAPLAGPDNLAYVLYTSGSTGRPKGVAVEHRSPVELVAWARAVFPAEDLAGVLACTSICFDLSVFELFLPLACGGTVILAENALALPALAAAARVTLVNTVPSAMAELAELAEGSLPAGLRTVNLAGEALLPTLVARIHRHAQVGRVLNLYGPSEDTTYSTWDEVERGAERVTIGRPLTNTRVHLVDRRLAEVPVGVPGELCLAGAGLARGYLGRPELTADRFVPDPFGDFFGTPGERLYRTGDLARRLPDGRIDYLGRIDHQVKIRGFRIELGEIETALTAHPELREVVVVARGDLPEGRALVAYVSHRREPGPDAGELRGYLRGLLPEPMVPARYVVLPALPRTPNGKVDRKVLPRPEGGISSEGYAAPRTATERAVAALWAELLGVERVGIHDNLFDLGGHSLLAIRFTSRLQRELGVDLSLREIFRTPTVGGLAERLEAMGAGPRLAPAPPLERVPRGEPLPLSYAQERLWFLAQLDPMSPAYNIPAALRLTGDLSVSALAGALAELVRRQEALRTTFFQAAGRPVQETADLAGLEQALPVVDLSALPAAVHPAELSRLLDEEARRPFDLKSGRLLRSLLVRTGAAGEPDGYVLGLTLHHIAADGWSLGVLAREVSAAYRALAAGRRPAAAELPVQYADYAVWQRQWLAGGEMERQLAFWRTSLEGAPAALELPADRPRSAVQSFHGAQRSLRLPRSLNDALKDAAHREGSTLFMALLAATAALLSRAAGQPDVVLGTPIANRNRPEVEGLIGFFANTLALRTRVAGALSFRDLLAQVREAALEAYAHQDLPFDKLVDELRIDRSPGRPPLVQVLIGLWDEPLADFGLPGVAAAPLATATRTAKLDLTLRCAESENGLDVQAEYSSDLFDGTTIERLLAHLALLLAAAAADPGRRLDAMPLASEAELHQLLIEWNDTARPEPPAAGIHDAGIHERFSLQAVRTPDAPAVEAGGERLTFRELDERSDRLARALRQLGVGPESRVGVRLPRSVDAVVALFGILKAGGAFVPLDPGAPVKRLEMILREAGAAVLITRENLPGSPFTMVSPDAAAESEVGDLPVGSAGSLAYVLYTSGSTGQPKGVMVEHRSVLHLLAALRESVGPDRQEAPLRVSLNAPLVFDASVKQWVQLLDGHGLVFVPEEVRADAARLLGFLRESAVQVLDCTPSQLSYLVAAGLLDPSEGPEGGALERVLVGGEDLPRPLWSALAAAQRPAFFNVYGPTECTVDATAVRVREERGGRPVLGRPIPNVRIHLLDAASNAVPLGSAGELCIGGQGVSRGYLGRPAQTAERFVPDPWPQTPGDRLYRSGDLARRLPDGTLELLGRVDRQVKLRGFRLELGEIEAVLGEHPEVREAAVLLHGGAGAAGDLRLAAYASYRREPAPLPDDLRSFLRKRLPEYMVPSVFVLLADLPHTRNGKVDRSALPALELHRQRAEPVKPGNPVEEVLAGMMAEVLGVDEVGVHDNFFEHGGNSLRVTELVAMIRDAFGVEVPLLHVFDRPTVSGLAAALTEDPDQRRLVEATAPILLGFAAASVEPSEPLL